jgi:hypothetical protein
LFGESRSAIGAAAGGRAKVEERRREERTNWSSVIVGGDFLDLFFYIFSPFYPIHDIVVGRLQEGRSKRADITQV